MVKRHCKSGSTKNTKENYYPNREDKSMQLPPPAFPKEQAVGQMETTITSYVDQMIAKFVLGRSDVNSDGDWNGYLNSFKQQGLDQYLKLYQDAYDHKYGNK